MMREVARRIERIPCKDLLASSRSPPMPGARYLVKTLLTPPEMSDVTSSNAPAMPSPPGAAR